MANTPVVAGENKDYGATHHDDEDLVVPLTMLDRNPHHPTSSNKPSKSSRPSWTTKKFVLGLMMGLTVAVVVVVARATVFVSVFRHASSADPPAAARTGPAAELLQGYPYVTITNKTPFDVARAGPEWYTDPDSVSYLGESFPCGFFYCCPSDSMSDGLGAGKTWTAPSRGLCLVKTIRASLWFESPVMVVPTESETGGTCGGGTVGNGLCSDRAQCCSQWGFCGTVESGHCDDEKRGVWKVECAPYSSSGTSHSIYSILLKGNDVNRNACCIRSSHELQACD